MRVSRLIKLLEKFKDEHGDYIVRAFDHRGDEGRPEVKKVVWMLGCGRTKTYCVVQSDDHE